MKSEDVPQAFKLVMDYLRKFAVYPEFSEEEFAHWLMPRDGVINSFVVEDPKTKKITDFLSFYTLPSTIIGNKDFKVLKAAYSYYNVATSMPMSNLMSEALIMAHKVYFRVYIYSSLLSK